MTIKSWPKQERPREKLLNQGATALSDAELLAVIIGSGTKGCSAVDVARSVLSDFGNLREIIQSDYKQICKVKGFGLTRFVLLQSAVEIVRRSLLESMKEKDVMSCSSIARDFLMLKMRKYEHEVFACLFLDNRHQVLAFEEMFHGTIDGASVHPREVVKRALQHNAAAIIFVHNHPSGSNEPSLADERITQELKRSLSLIDVRVLDHLVVGEKVTSFAERDIL